MIEGTLVNFRAVEDEDIPLLHRWFNDPEITRTLGSDAFPALSLGQERAIIEQLRSTGDHSFYAIVLKDGTLIGTCQLSSFDRSTRSCELGIAIGDKQQWGKGYGGAAVDLLLRIAFDGFNMHKVRLTVAAYNERGLRAYRRAGFREEGRLRDDRWLDGQYHDTVMMSILEAEWRAKESANGRE